MKIDVKNNLQQQQVFFLLPENDALYRFTAMDKKKKNSGKLRIGKMKIILK